LTRRFRQTRCASRDLATGWHLPRDRLIGESDSDATPCIANKEPGAATTGTWTVIAENSVAHECNHNPPAALHFGYATQFSGYRRTPLSVSSIGAPALTLAVISHSPPLPLHSQPLLTEKMGQAW